MEDLWSDISISNLTDVEAFSFIYTIWMCEHIHTHNNSNSKNWREHNFFHLKSKSTLTMIENSSFQSLYKTSSGNIGKLCKSNSELEDCVIYLKFSRTHMYPIHCHFWELGQWFLMGAVTAALWRRWWFAPVPETRNWKKLQLFQFCTSILHKHINTLSSGSCKLQESILL